MGYQDVYVYVLYFQDFVRGPNQSLRKKRQEEGFRGRKINYDGKSNNGGRQKQKRTHPSAAEGRHAVLDEGNAVIGRAKVKADPDENEAVRHPESGYRGLERRK